MGVGMRMGMCVGMLSAGWGGSGPLLAYNRKGIHRFALVDLMFSAEG